MRAVLVYFDKKQKFRSFLEAVKTSAATQGSSLCVLDGHTLADTDRLNTYEYIAIFFAEKPFFTSKPNTSLATILKEHGLKEGCKGCVLSARHGLFSETYTRNMMNALEGCGFVIDYFLTLKNTADAHLAGENIRK